MIDDLARGIQKHDTRSGAFEGVIADGQASDALRIHFLGGGCEGLCLFPILS